MALDLGELFEGIVGSGWDAETGKVQDFVSYEDGEYEGVVTDISHGETQKGGDRITIKIESLDDEGEKVYPRATLYTSVNDTKGASDYNARTIKTIMKLAHIADVELTQEHFEDFTTIPEALEPLLGMDLAMELKTDGDFQNGEIIFDEE